MTPTITPQQLRATGKYTLKQTEFGIKPYSAAGGTIKVKNEIIINFNMVAKVLRAPYLSAAGFILARSDTQACGISRNRIVD